jgi:hydroxymethylpyrimidine/phosphomethylpyrimidine kinase
VDAVAKSVEAQAIPNLVVDPVSVSKHRDQLLAPDAVDALKNRLIPLARVVTPNLYETELLLGDGVHSLEEMKEAAEALGALGPEAVLVKGGHLSGEDAIDVLWDGRRVIEIGGPRFDTADTHGTGCALSAAIAARFAHNDELEDAVRFAKQFVAGAIRYGLRIGKGVGPVNPGWRGIAGFEAEDAARKAPPVH